MMWFLARSSPTLDTAATDGAKLVMLGVIFVILAGLLAFIFRLRYLSRHPMTEADELEALVESGESDEEPPKSW
jgi:hypothetical protein